MATLASTSPSVSTGHLARKLSSSRFYGSRYSLAFRLPVSRQSLSRKTGSSVAITSQLSSSITPSSSTSQKRSVKVSVAIAPSPSAVRYALPTWAQFELGNYPVFWETATGRPPASGEQLTIWFNPTATSLKVTDAGVGFNGGFNNPIMCGGDPRLMTKKERGPNCQPFYTIKINVPSYSTHIEFSFTDGLEWDGPYFVELEIPAKWRNLPLSFFNEGLAKELGTDGACEAAIFPDSPYLMDRCVMPSSILHAEAARCDLDIVPGCTDPESPFFDPLATHDDGSCPIDVSDNTI